MVHWLERFTVKVNEALLEGEEILFRSKRGGGIETLEAWAEAIIDLAPDVTIIHTGANDLDDREEIPPELIAKRLTSVGQDIAARSGSIVIFSQALYRKAWRHWSTLEGNARVDLLNDSVKSYVINDRCLYYWAHKGLSPPPGDSYWDSVHLNDCGNAKFLQSLRHAAIHGCKMRQVQF